MNGLYGVGKFSLLSPKR